MNYEKRKMNYPNFKKIYNKTNANWGIRKRIWLSLRWLSTRPGNEWWILPSRSWTLASASWLRNRWRSSPVSSASWTRCPRRCGCAWYSPTWAYPSCCSSSVGSAEPSGASKNRRARSCPSRRLQRRLPTVRKCWRIISPLRTRCGSRWVLSCSKAATSLLGNDH